MINAVVHRDYREGVHSQFKVFFDKLNFWNIGKLPHDLSIEDMKKGERRSYPRNKLIAKVFRDCGLIERYGSGVKKVIEQFKKYGLKEPVFKESTGGIEVIVYSKDVGKDVGKNVGKDVGKYERKNIILNKIKNKEKFTYVSLAKEIGVTEKTIERDLKELKKDVKVRFVGDKRTGHWKIN